MPITCALYSSKKVKIYEYSSFLKPNEYDQLLNKSAFQCTMYLTLIIPTLFHFSTDTVIQLNPPLPAAALKESRHQSQGR